MAEFGLLSGLAYKHNFQQDIDNLQKKEILDRQAQIDASNRTKELSALFEFGEADDPWNSAQLKEFFDKKVSQMGSFISEHPGFEVNINEWIQVQRMSKELVDNKFTRSSVRLKVQREARDKWLNDPRNQESIDDESVINNTQELENFNRTGSIDGITENGLEYNWTPPDTDLNLIDIFRDLGNSLLLELYPHDYL